MDLEAGTAASRPLRIAVWGDDDHSRQVVQSIEDRVREALIGEPSVPVPELTLVSSRPDEELAGGNHLVMSTGATSSEWVDVVIGSRTQAAMFAVDRLAPWASKWHIGRRAPRRLVAELAASNPEWKSGASRLIARLRVATEGLPVLRIDHIGSTSVPGLAAKDLIDVQITTPTAVDALAVALAGTAAGFAHVPGDWFGLDRDGGQHREEVLVDSDPGRPVNINIRSAELPVARDALLFRDWLRMNADGRNSYEAMKRELLGRHVDDYSAKKEPFISDALSHAEAWATETNWRF
ncbi:MAG: GrpB family protein [Acidimicrobiales bacterium]